jgi:hypothetical protein
MRIPTVLCAVLMACGGEPEVDVEKVKMERLCGQTYSSTMDSLKDMYTQAGKTMPEMPTKEAYTEKCVALGFTEEQVKCMDPKRSVADPEGCKETLDAVAEKKKELGDLIAAALKGDKEEKSGGDGDKKEKKKKKKE